MLALVSTSLLSRSAVALAGAEAPADSTGGYRLLDSRATVRLLATVPGESLVQLIADPAGRLFLGGREAIFVVEPGDVRPGLKLAEIYRAEGDHWFMGLAVRGNDLYVAKHDAVLILPGAVKERSKITAKPIVWGFPHAKGWAFHQTLHDLKLGPDGKLYFTMGDPAWFYGNFRWPDHWFQTRIVTAGVPRERTITSVGGLFRCDPTDGSNLELVATGTRNNCGFDWNAAFDLLTTDNDHEQDNRYVPGRLLFMVPGGFYNWPRGWMDNRPEDLPALAGLGREVPVGLAVYGDVRLPADYRGNVLVARWGQQRIDRFALARAGSGYTAKEIPWLVCPSGRRPMAVAVGRGGRVYAIVSHMETNAESPAYTADLLEIDAVGEQNGFEGYEVASAPQERLWRELASPNLSQRVAAHNELARRGEKALDGVAERLARAQPSDPALPHLVRLAGLTRDPEAQRSLMRRLQHPDEDVRYDAIHALTVHGGVPWIDLWHLFRDPSLRVRRAVLTATADSQERPSMIALEETARLARSPDPYLRQLATRLMARNLPPENPHPLPEDPDEEPPPPPSPAGRLAAALADGFFLTIPPANGPLPRGLKLEPSSYEDASAGGERRIGLFTIDAWWRALEKTHAHEAAFRRLVRALDDYDPVVHLQALRSLARLADPREVPALEKIVDARAKLDSDTVDLALVTLARLAGPKALDRIVAVLTTAEGSTRRAAAEALVSLELPAERQSAAVAEALARLAKAEGLADSTRQEAIRRLATPALLRTLVHDPKTSPALRATALGQLAGLVDASNLANDLARIESNAGARLLGPAAILAATKLEPTASIRLLGQWLEAPSEDARRAAAQAIAAARRPEFISLAQARLAAETSRNVLNPLAESLLSDARGADDRDAALAALLRSRPDLDADLRNRLVEHLRQRPGFAQIGAELGTTSPASGLPATFAGIDWTRAWKAGSPERGRALFRAQNGVSCVACHRFRGEGNQNGPSLDEADKRLSVLYIVESVLKPNAQLAPQYRPWTISLASGEVATGILLEEGADTLTIGLNDGTTRQLRKVDIAERKPATGSIMPEGLVKTPEDLRDILSYLLTPEAN